MSFCTIQRFTSMKSVARYNMKSVAHYKDRIRTIFCQNCGGIAIADLKIKDAEALARAEAHFLCAKCAPAALELKEILEKLVGIINTYEELHRLREEEFQQDMALLTAKSEIVKGTLAQLKRERAQELDWKAKNN